MRVLVLQASSLQLGFLGCYGNTWINTPHVDRLASEGVVFDQHFAGDFSAPLSVISSHLPADSLIHITAREALVGSDATPLERTLEATVAALEELADNSRWLCWVDLPSLHPPWDVAAEFTQPYLAVESDEDEGPDEPFEPLLNPTIGLFDREDLELWERLHSTYAGVVTYVDTGLGLLFEEMKKLGLYDDLMLIFTAWCGLALGEHGIVGECLPWLHDEVVHMPLILRQAGGTDGGLRINALTQPVDLAATLLDYFGVGGHLAGAYCLLPLLRGEVNEIRPHCVSKWSLGRAEERSLRTLQHALVLPVQQPPDSPQRAVQLYLKPEDRWECNNVVQHHFEVAEEMERVLRAISHGSE
jgi:arylsulfatase A-like enzyme